MYYGDSFGDSYGSGVGSALILVILGFLVVFVGAFLIYFLFLKKSNDGKFTGFAGWLYNFLSFRTLLIDAILRITYLAATIACILSSLVMLFTGEFLGFLLTLIFGNLLIRVGYEFSMLVLIICRNVAEINIKMSSKNHVSGGEHNQAPAAHNYQQQAFNFTAPQQSAPATQTYAPFAQAAPAAEAAPADQKTYAIFGNQSEAAPAQETAAAPVNEAPAKKFCTACGKEVPSGSLFCTNCGSSIK